MAYSGCKSFQYDAAEHDYKYSWFLHHFTLCVRESGSSDVKVSFVEDTRMPGGIYWRWRWDMYLERYVNGSWTRIGSRSGWVNPESPSHRTFTNVARRNARMRVVVFLKVYDSGHRIKRYVSPTWTR